MPRQCPPKNAFQKSGHKHGLEVRGRRRLTAPGQSVSPAAWGLAAVGVVSVRPVSVSVKVE
jgi:hypothetical protein